MKQITIVYQIESQEHQTALLCAPNILRVSHNDSVLELTKAAGLAQAQQEEINRLQAMIDSIGAGGVESLRKV